MDCFVSSLRLSIFSFMIYYDYFLICCRLMLACRCHATHAIVTMPILITFSSPFRQHVICLMPLLPFLSSIDAAAAYAMMLFDSDADPSSNEHHVSAQRFFV